MMSSRPYIDRDEQRRACDALSALLSIQDLPAACTWEILSSYGYPIHLRGQLSALATDEMVLALERFTNYLDGVEWEVQRYAQSDGGGALRLHGTYGGVTVIVWAGLRTADLDAAEQRVEVTA